MDIYTRYNRKSISDRQVDTLIGLSTGLAADGKIDQSEAEVLRNWLGQCLTAADVPLIENLYNRVCEMLSDGVLDDEESAELLSLLQSITGETSDYGEVAKSATLPLCKPSPSIDFTDRRFLFTGTFAFGNRQSCKAAVIERGGICISSVTKSLDYLIIGSYVTDSWVHQSFGRKIQKAMRYRDEGVPLCIVSEQHWIDTAGL